MKRIPLIFFLVLAFLTSRQAAAQQVNEGFEGNTFPPPGWDTINVAGTARWVSNNDKPHTGNKAAFGEVATLASPDGDNLLITPKIYGIKNLDKLSFYATRKFTDKDKDGYFDTLYVLVSTTGKLKADFTDTLKRISAYDHVTYTTIDYTNIDLSAYANKDIYIAFRHYQNQGDGIYIDDVNVSSKLPSDVSSKALFVSQPGIVKTGTPINITDTLKNVGINPILSGLPVRYKVNNDPAISLPTTFDIAPGSTTTVTFSGANAFTPSTPGTYVVKVYADAPAGTELNRANDTLIYIFTVQDPIISFPYFQNFDNPQGWSFAGTGNWDYSNSEIVAYNGVDVINPAGQKDSAAVARFFFADAGKIFLLRSPLMNFTGIAKPMLNFYVAYRTATTQNDQLEVVVSLDGGATYKLVPTLYKKSYTSNPSLSTLPPDNSFLYVPGSANDWRHEIVDLSAYAGQSNVLIAFKGTSQLGNYLWIDNVNVISQTPSEYVVANVTSPNQIVLGTYCAVKFRTFPTPDSVEIQGHSTTPPATNFAANVSATSNDGTIETPNYVFPRWATIAFSGNAILRATYDDSMDISGLVGTSGPDKFYILKRSDQSGDWVALPTKLVGNYLVARGLTKFSDFAVGYYSSPVPLNVVNFNARLVNSVSMLQWKVAQVKNVTSFDIERKTGNTWENIGNVAVTSQSQTDYNFNDATAHKGINYYRLKINDGNGNFVYSNIVSVFLRSSLLVFQNAPNPFKDYTIIRYEIAERAPVKIQVFNLAGSRVAVLTDEVKDQGAYEIRFNTSQLTPGNYYLKFTAGDKTEVRKMIRL